VIVLLFFMIWVRATWPRIRYDRLMAFGWKVLLPLSLGDHAFITATGILLYEMLTTLCSSGRFLLFQELIGLFTVVMIYRELRRKAYERA
jgi:hypothetical protein